MQDKVCIITGATAGIGRSTALELARQGAELGLVCRNPQKAQETRAFIEAATGNRRVEVFIADLESQADIRRVAEELLRRYPKIHVLINNAGVVFTRRTETKDGVETTFAVNHLAYFLLTHLLLDRLRASAPSRIVNVASEAHRFSAFDLDDLEYRKRKYRGMRVYGASKLANILWTQELARRLEGTGVTANSLHPGGVNTGLGEQNHTAGAARWIASAVKALLRSPERGARTSVYLASAPELEGTSGRYFANCKPRRPNRQGRDPEAARRLWQASERMLGLPPTG
jgi:retinol dehydrogenase-12